MLTEVLVIDKTRNVSYSVQNPDMIARGGQCRRVVYTPGQSTWAAMRYSSEHIFDYVKLSPEYSIYEIAVPEEWLNKSVMELAVRQKYRVNVLGVKKGSELQPMPGPSHRFEKGEKVLILGHDRDVQALLRTA